MTVSWKNVQDAIKKAVVDTNVLVAGAVSWEDEPKPIGKVIASLHILYAQDMQTRNCYVEDEDNPGSFVWKLSTLYYIRVQIRVEAIFGVPGFDALIKLEQIKAKLLNPDLVLDADVKIQPDESTYIHHVSFPHDGRIVSSYAYELGFRAVIDYPLSGTESAAPNMQQVILEGELEIGADDPLEIDITVDRE